MLTAVEAPPVPGNWCRVGQQVMIPDGREGPVTSLEGDLCHVLVYGENDVSPWPFSLIEPIGPPVPVRRRFGH